MKICMFVKFLPVHLTGGMENHSRGLIDGLADQGHEVTVLTSPHPEGKKKEKKENLTIYYLSNEAKYFKEKFYKESAEKFKELDQRKDFDIIHSQHMSGAGYVKYCDKDYPLIVTMHGGAINELKALLKGRKSLKYWLAIPLYLKRYLFDERRVLPEASKVIAVSPEIKENLLNQFPLTEEKIEVIPNGIDTQKFKPLKKGLKEKWKLENKKVILTVGNIRKVKGYHLLIKALPDILKEKGEVNLLIVGKGPYLKKLKQLSKQLEVENHVSFLGRVSDEELVELYNLADVFSLPTLWHSEAFGIVNAEAMACETPVISSRIGGVPSVINDHEDGILIEPGNIKELKEKISEVLNNNDLAQKLGKQGRKKVKEKFSINKMVKDTIKVYKQALNKE